MRWYFRIQKRAARTKKPIKARTPPTIASTLLLEPEFHVFAFGAEATHWEDVEGPELDCNETEEPAVDDEGADVDDDGCDALPKGAIIKVGKFWSLCLVFFKF